MTDKSSADFSLPKKVSAHAPGKAVLAGEYAVLVGAPSLVFAVDRRAVCTITANESTQWNFTSSGFGGASHHSLETLTQPELMAAGDPARLLGWVLRSEQVPPRDRWLAELRAQLPDGAEVHTDTLAMFEGQNKLGIGSSAALITAISGALAKLRSNPPPEFKSINEAHRASQGGIGSGLDVATSLAGGLIRFENGNAEEASWPSNLHYRFIYSGQPASTSELVQRFNTWHRTALKSRKEAPLTALFDASTTLANRGINLDNLGSYVEALKSLDAAANIGIFSAEHLSITTAADRNQLLYKPCGAGGGDLGVAISDSTDDLDRFTRAVSKNFAVIDLEIAAHGLNTG